MSDAAKDALSQAKTIALRDAAVVAGKEQIRVMTMRANTERAIGATLALGSGLLILWLVWGRR